jgi:hypothetical protein
LGIATPANAVVSERDAVPAELGERLLERGFELPDGSAAPSVPREHPIEMLAGAGPDNASSARRKHHTGRLMSNYCGAVDEWLEAAGARLVVAVGDDPGAYALTDAEQVDLLDLARVAAHDSGERTNAPLLAYLVGVARGRHPERTVADLVDETIVKR